MSRSYDGADRAAEAYFRLVVELDLPSSPQTHGGSVCSFCGHGARTSVSTRKGGTRDICCDCQRPWSALDLTALVRAPRSAKMRKLSTKRAPRRPGDARCMVRLDDLMPLRPIFEPRPREMNAVDWSFHRLCLAAQAYKRLSVREIAEQGPRVLPRAPRGWTEDTVRGALDRMTAIVEDRLRREGIWCGPWRERWNEDQGGRRWRRPRISSRAMTCESASA